MFLYQILACAVHENIWKKSYKNNKFQMLAPTWNEKFELPGGYFASDIQELLSISSKNIEQWLIILQ